MTARLLTGEQVAEYLGVTLDTIYQWNARGTGPRRIKVGRHIRYRQADVDQWLAERTVGGSI